MTEIWRRLTGAKYRRLLHPVVVNRQALMNGDSESWHTHRQPQLVYTSRGVLRVITRDGAWTLGPYQGLWIASHMPHELQAMSEILMHSVYFELDMPLERAAECHVLVVSGLFHELISALAADRASNVPDRRLTLILPLLQQEMADARQAPTGGLPLPSDRRLQLICGELMDAPGNNEPLGDWADRVGASERTLERLFKQETGLTFGQWRQQLRLMESVALLAKGLPVSTIALELGYQTGSAFISMFKKAMGESPQQYLKKRIESPSMAGDA